ncbi:MAG TPA: dipeptide/oligopeptide/nickel ABC transporter ATP-binding protein [Chloroflexi bacterium]|nr:dipeptide/oligopeptide/nickel ABC transporter ATP-binding protein [Chloroflexota bacterium]
MADEPLLEVRDLAVDYLAGKSAVRAVDGVSLQVQPGEFLGIVGESGCGKSTLLFAIGRLLGDLAEISQGSVLFKGHNLVHLRERQLRHLRWRDFSVVMQSAMNALNPVMTIEAQLLDAIHSHSKSAKRDAHKRAAEVLRLVGIDPLHLKSYPHQLSGGMRQRAMIAMALLFTPDLIMMDEPTSALDVVGQRSLMMQIKELQRELGFAVIFVTHDMSLVRRYSDRIAIMYAGQIMELSGTQEVFADPKHPYTQGLLQAYPSIFGEKEELKGIPGHPPDLRFPPSGCRFHPRCPYVMDVCSREDPGEYSPDGRDLVRCFLYDAEVMSHKQLDAAR